MQDIRNSAAQFTKRELDCLLRLRKKPRKWVYLLKKAKTDEDGLNLMLSRMHYLYYVVDGESIMSKKIKLNQIGETVAQAEFDRRFDMYYTRAIALLALVTSVASVLISALQ